MLIIRMSHRSLTSEFLKITPWAKVNFRTITSNAHENVDNYILYHNYITNDCINNKCQR